MRQANGMRFCDCSLAMHGEVTDASVEVQFTSLPAVIAMANCRPFLNSYNQKGLFFKWGLPPVSQGNDQALLVDRRSICTGKTNS